MIEFRAKFIDTARSWYFPPIPIPIRKEPLMNNIDPLTKSKEEYTDLIDRLGSPDSPVGIDAQYTHAVIIAYLQQITARLEAIEGRLARE